jgi:hypothetical protein
MNQLEQACSDYFDKIHNNYGEASFNALKMGMTEGDIINQAKGLIRVWASMYAASSESSSDSPLFNKDKRRNRKELGRLYGEFGIQRALYEQNFADVTSMFIKERQEGNLTILQGAQGEILNVQGKGRDMLYGIDGEPLGAIWDKEVMPIIEFESGLDDYRNH